MGKTKYFTKEDKEKALRASKLVRRYRYSDKVSNRGRGDLTVDYILENIFTQPCTHCGKTGWNVIGCNRLDNSKPHTEDNVEPCCRECNSKVSAGRKKRPVDQIDPATGEVVATWDSSEDARRIGGFAHVFDVANGLRKQDKGYIFRYL